MEHGGILFRLVHVDDRVAELDIAVGDRTTHIYCLRSMDKDYARGNDADSQWETDTLDTLARLLLGRYQIDEFTCQGRPYRTHVTASSATPEAW